MLLRAKIRSGPALRSVNDETVRQLGTTSKHRELAADKAKRRGFNPMVLEDWAKLQAEVVLLEAKLRDANFETFLEAAQDTPC